LRGKAFSLAEMSRNRQHHPNGQILPITGDKNASRRRQSRQNRLGIRHLRMGYDYHGQIGQRHRNLRLILSLDYKLFQFYPQARGRLRKIQNAIQHGDTLFKSKLPIPPSVQPA
jgi:hypothetical protein